MSVYSNKAASFKAEIQKALNYVFKKYNNELFLYINDINLLSSQTSCIKSSTAIGYCIEEFVFTLLCRYFKTKKKIKIIRDNDNGTQNSSYDFKILYKDSLFYINIKVVLGQNNAVAAINKLYNDYVEKDNDKEKHFMVLKIYYQFSKSKIMIKKYDFYFLEEVNFSNGFKSDNRNWSQEFNPNSGRLQISDKFLSENRIPFEEIDYKFTSNQLKEIFLRKIKKI